jgi:KaiC/GvpD/RAD55 family RecA-like ATPase
MPDLPRQSTGIPRLDQALDGGLIPGTMTVVLGATGIGKSQLGVLYANAGKQQEGETGILFDLTTRGDSQNQPDYAQRLCQWSLQPRGLADQFDATSVFDRDLTRSDLMHVFHRGGRRVTIGDMQPEEWQEFKADLMRRLDQTIGFFYGNFVHGVRRVVIDGVEPTDRDSESFQFHLFDYVYHQVLRKEHDWLARDLLRVRYRAHEERVQQHAYNSAQIGAMLLYTSREVMIDELIRRPIQAGDVLSNANTIILMGKSQVGASMGRALHVAKHRGSACDDAIIPFQITSEGFEFPN